MFRVLGIALLIACGGVIQRFPDDVAASLAHDDLRRLETDHFIIYYPARRRAEIDRFLGRAERCASVLRESAIVKSGAWRDKMVIAMPEVAFNNAFVLPELAGYEAVSVIPTTATLDFATEFGLPPDPGFIACHELVHYVHLEQIDGLWHNLDRLFGHLYTPQVGFDPWFLEGLATHYEAALSPGLGRPTWPIFTGMFAAGYAGEGMSSGDMSASGRLASVGHHYLVGSMFVRFLTERYGERPLWVAIANHAATWTGLFWTGAFKEGFGISFGDLFDEFDAWVARTFPVRPRPASQRVLATAGNDARYARGRDGTEAWVGNDVDVPTHLVIRDAAGATLADLGLVDVVPPRTLVQADPLVVSGLSITADGNEVWLTMIDLGATFQIPRLLRWRRGEHRVTEIATDLGPGATIDPTGSSYYYCAVDGDRWSLAAFDLRRRTSRVLVDMPPGTYVLGAQISGDGRRLVANVWDGTGFVAWEIDAASGARLAEHRGTGPIYDASFTDDGRVMYLGVVAGRFQAFVAGTPVTDAPYAVLGARETRGTIRFLDRERWEWELDEVLSPPPGAETPPLPEPVPPVQPPAPPVLSDEAYSPWEHFFFPQLRAPTIVVASTGTPHLGLVLGGGDRLGMQRWTIAGFVQPRAGITDKLHWGGNVAYLNTMLAPWQILAAGSVIDWVDPVDTTDPDVRLAEDRRTRDASLSVRRIWRQTLTTTLSGLYTDDFDRAPGSTGIRRHLGGPALSLDWLSAESTPYTGARRALLASVAGAYYPRALSTFSGDIVDASGSLGAVVPLPIGRRHTIAATLRGRAMFARDDAGLLQLGGDAGLAELYSHRSLAAEPPSFDDARFPPGLRFVEPLRGYEDYAIATNHAAIADVSWRYPVIIDRGVAATLWVLPASFLSELDLELFATGAVDDRDRSHAAAGAAVSLRIALFRLPLIVSYQIARRVRDDDALVQLVGIAPDL